jgi:hypothetical protein
VAEAKGAVRIAPFACSKVHRRIAIARDGHGTLSKAYTARIKLKGQSQHPLGIAMVSRSTLRRVPQAVAARYEVNRDALDAVLREEDEIPEGANRGPGEPRWRDGAAGWRTRKETWSKERAS